MIAENGGVPSRFDKLYHPSKLSHYYHMNILMGKQCKKKMHGATFDEDLVEVISLLFSTLEVAFELET
jgi:hypothetical protein